MIPKSRKRKYKQQRYDDADSVTAPVAPDPSLFVQAHEADLVRGPRAAEAAQSLELECYEEEGRKRWRFGDGLILWTASGGGSGSSVSDSWGEERVQLGHAQPDVKRDTKDEQGLWVDRYDARLLLDALPGIPLYPAQPAPTSPGGWSDLPSDAEDTFFFSAEEVEDYRREKRRRLIDRGREDRLRALRAEAKEEEENLDGEPWGGSDEEPDEAEKALMQRTASHILNSPNPAQLEMRILANHGADPRFAFLRGRWSRAWKITKGRIKLEAEKGKAEKEVSTRSGAGLGGLVGYGDSDEESASEENHAGPVQDEEVNVEQTRAEMPPLIAQGDDDEVKKARRERAKQWAAQRRNLQTPEGEGGT